MIKINLIHAVAFGWMGKFQSPSPDWVHTTRKLLDYELIVVDSGTLYIACDDREYEVHAGEYVLMGPCEQQRGSKPSECSFHWLHFVYNTAFNELDGDYIFIPEHGKLTDMERMVRTIGELYSIWHRYEDRHYASFAMTSVLIELSHLSQSAVAAEQPSGEKKACAGEILCRRIKQYISWNCRVTLKIRDMALYLGYSEKYISTVFKRETGSSIRQYLDGQIVERSKTMLLGSHATISGIAYELGFSDVQNFSRMFRRVSGITPTQFRERFTTLYE